MIFITLDHGIAGPRLTEVASQEQLEQTCFFTAVDSMDISIFTPRFEQRSTTDGASHIEMEEIARCSLLVRFEACAR